MATPASTSQIWRFGVFEVDTHRVELRRSGAPVKLREQSFLILIHLLEHAGEIVTREELRRVLWPSDTFVDFDHSMNAAMMKLREALGDIADEPIYVETIPKRGYRFIAPVSSIDLSGQPSMVPSKTIASPSDEAQLMRPLSKPALDQRRRRLRYAGVLGSLLLVGVGSVVAFRYGQLHLLKTGSDRAASNYRIIPVTSSLGKVATPVITQNGRQIAYAWNGPERGPHFDIYWQVIGSSDKPLRLANLKSGWARYPAWSPDCSLIAFTWCAGGQDGVYIVPVTGGEERKLTSVSCQYSMPEPLTWFAGGTRMLMIDRCFAGGQFGLVVFSLETGEKKCLADFGPSGYQRTYRYSLSPDESTVAFNPA